MKKILMAAVLVGLSWTGTALADEECRTIEWIRVDSAAQLEQLQDVCEITRSLAVFTDEAVTVALPKLKKVPFINVDSTAVTGVYLPALEHANIIQIKGRSIEAFEAPRLRRVNRALYILSSSVINLDLVSLEFVDHLVIKGNPQLEEVFTPFTETIMEVSLANNPKLVDENVQLLLALQHPDGPAMRASRRAATEEARRLRVEAARRYHDRVIAPTGTAARFGTIGFYNYGNHYRRYRYPRYRAYYPVIRPWLWGAPYYRRYWP